MNLFVDYVQPLTVWLQDNPRWSLFITFLISLTESLAIIGSIVPGSITMTAIGILAGSGIMRIDLTLLAAVLGAVAGDSLSYTLGYYYSERLADIWPFSKYPKWLDYGKDFFAAHGGKSVLIGRFVGPLRSIIPVIAGVLHMKQWRFLIANILSAIGWSLLYIMPGVIIGAASHELSAESATRFFLVILLVLGGIWLVSLILKRSLGWLNSILKWYLHDIWLKFNNNSLLVPLYNTFTPKFEKNHYATASLFLLSLLCTLCFLILLGFTLGTEWLNVINFPTNIIFKSFNILILRSFFIFCTQLTSTITLISFCTFCCCWFIYHKKSSILLYLLSLMICSSALALILTYFIHIPRPSGLLIPMTGSSFPAVNLEVATALYVFIVFYSNNTYALFTNTIKSVVFVILGLSGLGAIYLGDYWLSDVCAAYFAGTAIALVHWLIYRKSHLKLKKTTQPLFMIVFLFMSILLSSLLSTYINFQSLSYNHTPYHKEFSLRENTWWHQKKPLLPLYHFSRIGTRISMLNLQFAGNLDALQQRLEQNGWESHLDSFFTNLLRHMSGLPNHLKLPLFTQLYENKAPMLMMTYTNQQLKFTLELRVWASNYNLTHNNKPLWIGSVHTSVSHNKKSNSPNNFLRLINPIECLIPNEQFFVVKKITLPEYMIKTTKYPTPPYLILIKEKR